MTPNVIEAAPIAVSVDTMDPGSLREAYKVLANRHQQTLALLRQAAPIVHAHAGASHMLDGFRPKRNKWDELAESVDAALAKHGEADHE